MKKIISIVVLSYLISLASFSQKYKVGAMSFMGNNVKSDALIIINDSTVTLKGNGQNYNYKLIKIANGIVYFTDGVMTNSYTILNQSGKIKGFKYDKYILYTPDNRQNSGTVIYYATQDTLK